MKRRPTIEAAMPGRMLLSVRPERRLHGETMGRRASRTAGAVRGGIQGGAHPRLGYSAQLINKHLQLLRHLDRWLDEANIGVGEIATKRAEVFFRAVLRPMSLPHLSPTWSDDDWVDSQGVRSPG
jgi:hypothetical protein